MNGLAIFVEGATDRAFVHCLLQNIHLPNVEVEAIGGDVSKLPNVQYLIEFYRNQKRCVVAILDADSNPEQRREEYRRVTMRHDLRLDDLFLLPDDTRSGELETLLEEIAHPCHRAIHRCFSGYLKCLQQAEHGYIVPDPKARIYAYCEALGIETHGKKRDYGDTKYWDVDAAALDPLKAFLRKCADMDETGETA